MKIVWAMVAIGAALATEFASCDPGLAQAAAGQTNVQHLNQSEFDTPRVISGGSPVKAVGDSGTIRIGTWNIDRGGDLGTVETELERHPVDLLLLQEVDWNTARSGKRDEAADLARRLHFTGSYAIEFEELSQERDQQQAFIGQATLTRLPVRNSRVLRFSHQSGFWQPRDWLPSSIPLMQRRLGSRVALISELEFAGHLLVVYNAHLESRSYGRIQAQQLDEILTDLERYPAGTAVILGGDLNTKYFPSIFLKKLERAGFLSATGNQIERTHTIAMALDWIFAKGAVIVSDGEVRRDMKGSDHYPLFAELKAK